MARQARGWMFRVLRREFLSRARRRLQRATHHQQLQVTPSVHGNLVVDDALIRAPGCFLHDARS
jgi:DNA-directed RNA polymerase specialized sigma24 family protein